MPDPSYDLRRPSRCPWIVPSLPRDGVVRRAAATFHRRFHAAPSQPIPRAHPDRMEVVSRLPLSYGVQLVTVSSPEILDASPPSGNCLRRQRHPDYFGSLSRSFRVLACRNLLLCLKKAYSFPFTRVSSNETIERFSDDDTQLACPVQA